MISPKEQLQEVLRKVELPLYSIKEAKDLWTQTKKIIFEDLEEVDVISDESTLALKIYINLKGKLQNGCLGFYKEEIEPSDEELDLMLEAIEESSQVEIFLSEFYPTIFEKNEKIEKFMEEVKEKILKEKVRRSFSHSTDDENEKYNNNKKKEEEKLSREALNRKTDELQKEVDYLKSKNKLDKANKLQDRVEIIRQNTPTKDTPTKDTPTKSNLNNKHNPSPSKSFFIWGGVLVGGVFLLLIISGNRKKNKKK